MGLLGQDCTSRIIGSAFADASANTITAPEGQDIIAIQFLAATELRALVAKDKSASKARLLVSHKIGVSPTTIYNWEKEIFGKIIQSKGSPVSKKQIHRALSNNGITKPHITSVNLHVPGKGEITLDHELLSHISRLAGFVS